MQVSGMYEIRNTKMHLFVLLITFFLSFSTVKAQNIPPVAISVGYFGPIPFEPGIRIGFHTPVKSYDNGSLMLNIHTGYFFRNRDNSNLLIGGELGWRFQKEGGRNINTFSVGSAYVMQWEVTGFTINLQGETVARERELRHQFLPTFNYEYSRLIGVHWSPFFKLGYGYKFSATSPNSGVALWELGTRYTFN